MKSTILIKWPFLQFRKRCQLFGKLLILFCLLTSYANAQTQTISGKVVSDIDPSGIPGASVVEKNTTNGTVTDINGNFTLKVNEGATIVISYVGYITEEIAVENQTTINVNLVSDIVSLQEIAVIGYGTVKKSDATGAVAVVSAKDFNKGAINSPQELLLGKAPGVVITSNSGAPGNSSTIRIRGGSSLNASNDPLIVIDGVPITNVQIGGSSNILSSLNPNDIESFTILKDASATAIYGSRASNGVILITTKRGGESFSANYSVTTSLATIPKLVDVYSGDEYRALINERYGEESPISALLGDDNTNWQKQIYKNAFGQDHNLNVSGTFKKIKLPYRVSLGYNNTDGILKTYNYERTTLSVGLDPSLLKDHLKININLKGMYNSNNFADQGAVGNAIVYDPTKPVYNGNTRWRGYTTWTVGEPNASPINLATANPVAQLDLTDNTSIVKRSIGNVQFDYKFHFLEDLHANLNLGYDYSESEGHNNVKDSTQWVYIPEESGGRANPYRNQLKNELLDFYLNYSKSLESIKSKIDVVGGYSWSRFYRSLQDSSMNESKTIVVQPRDFETEYFLVSFFGRVNYSLMDKYLVTLTLRNDGTSKFAPENRWGLFPAAAFAWKINNENFLKDSKLVSDLKLRLGYGVTGQQDIRTSNSNYDDYPYQAVYTRSDNASRYPFGDVYYNTYRPDGYDKNIKWEQSITSNIGFDYGFFGNRITGTIDYYNRKTKDLISRVSVPAGSNFTGFITTNVGSMENHGLEFSINSKIVAKSNWNWEVGYNLAYNKNKITNLNLNNDPDYYVGDENSGIGGTTAGTIRVQKVGEAANSFFVYKQVYDANGKPIEDAFVDQNNDGIINSSDLYIHNNPAPDVTMGLSSRVSYKNWDLSLSARANLGNYVYNNVAANSTYNLYSSLGFLSNTTKFAEDTKFLSGGNSRFSDYFIQNASFLRLDFVNIGYKLPEFLNGKASIRINGGVQNAFVITKYKGLDPEISGGMDNNFFPRARTFLLGLNCQF